METVIVVILVLVGLTSLYALGRIIVPFYERRNELAEVLRKPPRQEP